MRYLLVVFLLLQWQVNIVVGQSNDEVCKGSFRQSVLGESIGTTNLNVADIDNDGINEMILSAGDETFEDGRFWYVLKFSGWPDNFKQSWVSSYYFDRIMVMSVMDLDDNGVMEVVLGLQSGRVEIYSTSDMSLQSSFIVDRTNTGYYNRGIVTVLKADADNDGSTELVILSSDTTYLYSGNPPALEHTIPKGDYDLECGNVDNEPSLELCYSSGNVIRLQNNQYQEIWDFNELQYFSGSRLGLADQDGDGNDEIFSAEYDTIRVWDVESQSEKYHFQAEIDYHSFYMSDIDGDGVKELLYGDNNYGNVYCRRITTNELLWSKIYGHGGLNCIAVANVDNEPFTEVIWATAHGSTGEDQIFTFDLETMTQEWESTSVNGPFEKIQIFDVDNDGIEELVTVSLGTKDFYAESLLSFWDPFSQELEWKSPDTLFYYTNHFFDFVIHDADNDGISEIILPGAKNYGATIYVLDPISHQIERSFIFDLPERFTDIEIGDPDNDGNQEYVLGTSTTVTVVDPVTGNIEWSLPPYLYFDANHIQLMVENIDTDPAEEILIMSDSLKIIDGITHNVITVCDKMGSFDLYDIDGDGIKDIIIGTLDGQIGVLRSPDYSISWLPIQMEKRIGGLRVFDITGTDEPELIFVSSGRVWFSTLQGHMEYSNKITRDELYEHWHIDENIEISDFDHNGEYEVFVGGSFQVTELGTHCYECVDFIATTQYTQPTCEPGNDGIVSVSATGGMQPYSFAWNTGNTSNMINGLSAGTYTVISTDHVGCKEENKVTLVAPRFNAHLDASYKTGCDESHAAILTPNITEGVPPYHYQWSTGATGASLHTIEPAVHSVTITDARQCNETLTTEVVKDTFSVTTEVRQITCVDSPGWISIQPQGSAPFTYSWSNGGSDNTGIFTESGIYSVIISSALGCSQTHSFEILPYSPLSVNYVMTPDNPYTTINDGSVAITTTGGFPPYRIDWYTQNGSGIDSAVSLKPGIYTLFLTDSAMCTIRLDVQVRLGDEGNFCRVYPIPAIDWITIDLGENYQPEFPADVVLYNLRGKEIVSSPITNKQTRLDIYYLPEGLYMLRVRLNGNEQIFKIEKVH